MKIVVVGGSGFIGTQLVKMLLEKGHDVLIYDKNISDTYPDLTVQGDVRDKSNLVQACKSSDVIYNLAAEHADNVRPLSLYYDVNVGGAHNIIAAARENNIRHIVFTSTVALYGLNVGVPDETFPPKPFNDYGKSKWEAEKYFSEWCEQDDENSLTIIRPVVIFGEGNRGNVYNLLRQINSGKFVSIGDGKNVKSMGYVLNIASFLMSSLDFKSGVRIFNYADKPDMTTNELVHIAYDSMGIKSKLPSIPYFMGLLAGYVFDFVGLISGRKFSVSSIRIKKFCANTSVSADKLLNSGFKPKFSIEEGLKRMINHEFMK